MLPHQSGHLNTISLSNHSNPFQSNAWGASSGATPASQGHVFQSAAQSENLGLTAPTGGEGFQISYQVVKGMLKNVLATHVQNFLYNYWSEALKQYSSDPNKNPYHIMQGWMETVKSWNHNFIMELVGIIEGVDTKQDHSKWHPDIVEGDLASMIYLVCSSRVMLIMMARVDKVSNPTVNVHLPSVTTFIHQLFINIAQNVYEGTAKYCQWKDEKGHPQPNYIPLPDIMHLLDYCMEFTFNHVLPVRQLVRELVTPLLNQRSDQAQRPNQVASVPVTQPIVSNPAPTMPMQASQPPPGTPAMPMQASQPLPATPAMPTAPVMGRIDAENQTPRQHFDDSGNRILFPDNASRGQKGYANSDNESDDGNGMPGFMDGGGSDSDSGGDDDNRKMIP